MFLVGDGSMRIAIQADEGDEVSISADYISAEQAIVTLEIENAIYNSEIEIEAVTLTIEKARELASALLSVIEAIEFVRTPTNLVQFDRRIRSSSNVN
jgi:predicted secreted protein